MQTLLRQQMHPRNTTDDQIVVAIKEIMITKSDMSSAQVTRKRRNVVYWNPNGRSSMISCKSRMILNEVDNLYVTKKRVWNVRQRFHL